MNVKQFIRILATVTAVLLTASYAVAQGNGGGHGNGNGNGNGGGGGPQYVTVALNQSSGMRSRALALNNSNVAVGFVENVATSEMTAVVWTLGAGNFVVEHSLVGGFGGTNAQGINEFGEIVGSDSATGLYWSSMFATPLVLPPLAGDAISWAFAINDSGVIVGCSGESHSVNYHPVAWRVDSAVWGPLELASDGEAWAVNSEDIFGASTVVGNAGGIPVSWTVQAETGGELSLIAGPTAVGSSAGTGSAYAVNDAGDVCGRFLPAGSSHGNDAFQADFGGPLTILPSLGGNGFHNNAANAINWQQNCVGRVWNSKKGWRAALWQADGSAVDLEKDAPSVWVNIDEAYDINEGGSIVGVGGFADSQPRAWIMLLQ